MKMLFPGQCKIKTICGKSMNRAKLIAKNTAILLLAEVVSKIFMFIFIMYTARYLGAKNFGIFSFALAFTGILGIFSDIGLAQLTTREVARNRSSASKYFQNVLGIKIILAIMTFILILLIINTIESSKEMITVVYLIGVATIFYTFILMFNSIFQAFEVMKYISIGKILSSVLLVSVILLTQKKGFDIVDFATLYVSVFFVILCYSYIICVKKFVSSKIEFDWVFWKKTIKEALPFGLTSYFIMIYLMIDSVMLSFMQGDEIVGWYNAGYRLILALTFIPISFHTALFPAMSQLYINSQNSLKHLHENFFKYMIILAVPIAVGTTLLADRIVILIFGSGYLPSIIVIKILIWSLVFIFARTPIERLFESVNQPIAVTKVFGISAILNIFLNFMLIPKYSYIGAAAATLITDFTVFIILFYLNTKIIWGISLKKALHMVFKISTVSMAMGASIFYFYSINLYIIVFLAIIIYAVGLILFNIIDKNDINLFKKIIFK